MFEVYCKWKPALQKLQRVIDGDVSYVGRSTSGGMLWCLQRVIVDRRLRPALLWITDQAGRLPNETARELAKYSKECLPVISRWPFPLPPLFVSYHPIPHLGRITMEHHQYTTDSRSFTWSESLIMSNLGWQWQHGYLSPRGFMPYYEKISGVCIRCRRIHTLTFFGTLRECEAAQPERDKWFAAWPDSFQPGLRAWYARVGAEDRMAFLRGFIEPAWLNNIATPAEITTGTRRVARRLLTVAQSLLKMNHAVSEKREREEVSRDWRKRKKTSEVVDLAAL